MAIVVPFVEQRSHPRGRFTHHSHTFTGAQYQFLYDSICEVPEPDPCRASACWVAAGTVHYLGMYKGSPARRPRRADEMSCDITASAHEGFHLAQA